MSKFFTLLTKVGEAKLANATALGQTIKFEKMAIGDGDGELPVPDQKQTALVNEVRRELLNAVETDPDNPNWIVCEQVIPENVGGWTIREVGIYDVDGDLIAVGNFPETYKPILEEGSGRTQTIRIVLQVSSTASVELKIDPSIVLATRKYVDEKDQLLEPKSNAATDDDIDNESNDKKHVKLPQFWRALTPQRLVDKLWLGLAARIFPVGAAIPWFTDVAPDGFGMFKGQAFDMATYPELAKVFPDGIIPDMRGCGVIGKEDGETVGVFEEGEVKSHGHPNSTVSGTDLGTKTTNTTGNHYHASNTPNEKALNSTYGSGLPSSVNTNSYGRHASTSTAGNHA
ncbi:phage tail-collar fiber domain-containing protein, partial [Vibrio fluvialis]